MVKQGGGNIMRWSISGRKSQNSVDGEMQGYLEKKLLKATKHLVKSNDLVILNTETSHNF